MFNLVKYRWLFIIISLVIIVPGLISLIATGLNVGIDFRSGATVDLRPQKQLKIEQIRTALKPLNLADLQVVLGDAGTNATQAGDKIVWVRLNTQVDGTVQSAITTAIQSKYGSAVKPPSYADIPGPDGKLFTLVTLTGFATAPQVSDIQTTLAKLPNTGSTGSSVASTTPVATTGAGTPGPVVKVTPTVASTPIATGTPVKIVDIQQGHSTQVVSIATTSAIGEKDLPKVYAALLNSDGTYVALNGNYEVSPSVASDTIRNSIFAVIAASVLILLYISFAFRKVSRPWRYGACAIIALLHDVLVVVGIFSILGWALHIQVDALFITALLTVVGFSVHDTIVVFDRIRENMQRRTSETFDEVVNASLVQTLARSLNTSLTVIFTLSALTLFGGTGSVHNFTLALLIGIVSGTYSSIFNASMLLVMWEKGELSFGRRRGRIDSPKVTTERELARTRG
ncbi:MAG: hypothetical protein PVS3B3_18980 [Ktedonobacteraceae bacterium]